LYAINKEHANFVTLAKKNMQYERVYSHPSDINNGLHSDQTIKLTGVKSALEYPEKFRRIHYYDKEQKRYLYFITNNFEITSIDDCCII
jgi:hypothetical protein